MITITKSKISDLKKIMRYVKKNFYRNHILSTNKKVIKWWYYNNKNKTYNFLLAKKNKKIIGFLGYIKNSHFQNFFFKDVVWFSPLHSLKTERNYFSGIELINRLLNKNKNKIIGTTGCNPMAKKIYSILGFKTGHLNHYYLINPNLKKYHICSFKKKPKKKLVKKNKLKIIKSKNLNFIINKKELLYYQKKYFKDMNYFLSKFSKNPFYHYCYFIIKKENKNLGFFVARECFYKKSKVLRFVDYFGDVNCLKKIEYELQKIVINYKYEYIDFYNYGINKKILFLSGFKLSKGNHDIIPNFFEPFEKKNIEINFAFWPKKVNLMIFKGDCDQERPSII